MRCSGLRPIVRYGLPNSGLPYVFADFINPNGSRVARYYRQTFTPSDLLSAPRTSVAVWAICAETDEEAERLSFSFRMMMTMLFRGQSIPVPTIETRAAIPRRRKRLTTYQVPVGRRIITGYARRACAKPSKRWRMNTKPTKFSSSTSSTTTAARLRSYELIAREFGMDN